MFSHVSFSYVYVYVLECLVEVSDFVLSQVKLYVLL